jgi:hypothetical protein
MQLEKASVHKAGANESACLGSVTNSRVPYNVNVGLVTLYNIATFRLIVSYGTLY